MACCCDNMAPPPRVLIAPDGSLYYCTLVDPIFIFIPISETARMLNGKDSGKFRQLDEIFAGVEPKWEDPKCANGGKWIVPCSRKATLDIMWLETISFSNFNFFIGSEHQKCFRDISSICCLIWLHTNGILLTKFLNMLLMALIGEQFDESEKICGVVASVRQRQDKLALWTKTASNEAIQVNIGKKWKEIIDYNDKMVYSFHDDSRREKPSRGGRYNV